jgi:hypothetical protein
MTCSTLGSLTLGGIPSGRGLPPASSRLLAQLQLLKPHVALSLSLRVALLAGSLTLIGQTFALIRGLFTFVGGPLSLIREPVALIRSLLALIHNPFSLVGDPRGRPRLSPVTTSLAAQPVTLALQHLIIDLELRRTPLDLRSDTRNLDPRNSVVFLQRASVQLPQIGPIRFELRQVALERGAAPLKLSPLRIASRRPHRRRRLVARRALLMHEHRVSMHSPVRAGADKRSHNRARFDRDYRSPS